MATAVVVIESSRDYRVVIMSADRKMKRVDVAVLRKKEHQRLTA